MDKPSFISVPFYVERDGTRTFFLPNLRTPKGYCIGAKDAELWVSDYWDALREVSAMFEPRFRRANAAGNRGIVRCEPNDKENVKVSYIQHLIEAAA